MWLGSAYEITSNREQGNGRYDILLRNKNIEEASLLFELKYTKDDSVDLANLAQQACEQITAKHYDHNLQHVIKIGLAHREKQVEMCVND